MKQCDCGGINPIKVPDFANCSNFCAVSVSYTATGEVEVSEPSTGNGAPVTSMYSASATASASATGSTPKAARIIAFKLAQKHANNLVKIRIARYLKFQNQP